MNILMRFYINSTFGTPASIFFSIIAILVTIALGFVIFRIVRREHFRYKEENDTLIEGVISRAEIINEIGRYINRVTQDGFFCLMYIDVDEFTEINNVYGVAQADKILESLATNLLKSLPRKTLISRFKKDEFLVFIKNDYDRNELKNIADSLLEAINTPIKIFRDSTAQISGSMGVAYFPAHGYTVKQLLQNLELATYISKRDGGNRYTVYQDEFAEKESVNMEYYKEVKTAIKEKEFTLYYQPIINVNSQTLYGFEALIRWSHPIHGVLAPQKFLSILEQSGDINWVGLWGLDTIIRKIIELKSDYASNDIHISLNLSPKQLLNDTIVEDFKKILKKYKVNPSSIILEVEEFAMFEKIATIKTNLLKLKDLGFIIAIDGFGLDYSTMSKLERMPVDAIKLNRDFLTDDENSYLKAKFITMLVDYATTNEKEIIAYGVENQAMIDYVKASGLSLVQGYYFSKPMEEKEVTAYIKYRKWMHMDTFAPNEHDKDEFDESERIKKIRESEDVLQKMDLASEVALALADAKRDAELPKTGEQTLEDVLKEVENAEITENVENL